MGNDEDRKSIDECLNSERVFIGKELTTGQVVYEIGNVIDECKHCIFHLSYGDNHYCIVEPGDDHVYE